jgi:tubulin-specific chaperone D
VPHWRTVIDMGLKHRNSTVQEAAAYALAEVSKLVDCSAVVQRYVDTYWGSTDGELTFTKAHLLGTLGRGRL